MKNYMLFSYRTKQLFWAFLLIFALSNTQWALGMDPALKRAEDIYIQAEKLLDLEEEERVKFIKEAEDYALELRYLLPQIEDKSGYFLNRAKIDAMAGALEALTHRATTIYLDIPCISIKQFQASRRYKAWPFHTPCTDWQFSQVAGPKYSIGTLGSFEQTSNAGANSDWSKWWRLWLKFDLSILAAYPYCTVEEAEVVIDNVSLVLGPGEADGVSIRLFKLYDDATGQYMPAPRNWKDTDSDYTVVPPSLAGTPYDKSSTRLRFYGYGSHNEILRINPLVKELDLWRNEGNYGLILNCMSLSPGDHGNRFHIKDILQNNIKLKLKIVN